MSSKPKKRCPECGVLVRLDRMEDHFMKVHPKADRSKLLTEEEKTVITREKEHTKKVRSRKPVYIFLIFLVTVVICALAILSIPSLKPGGNAPDFALKDTDGNTVRLSDYRGRVILLSMIDPKGSLCQSETRDTILPLYTSYGSRVIFMSIDVQILGQDTLSELKDFKTKIGAGWKFLLDDGSVRNSYSISSTPAVFIINTAGDISYQHTGISKMSDISSHLDKLLQ